MGHYADIQPGGGNTGAERNLTRRIALIDSQIDLRGLRILDCGCGEGQYVKRLFDFSQEVYGVEYHAEKVRAFQSLGIHPDRVRQGDIAKLDFPNGFFDFILLNEVLEHVPDEGAALAEIVRVLKPKGLLAVFSPNRLYPFETHAVYLRKSAIKIPYYTPFIPYVPLALGNRLFAYNARNYFPWELKAMLTRSGFQVIKQTYVWQTFENISGCCPRWILALSPVLRALSLGCEKIALVRCFGISQALFALRP